MAYTRTVVKKVKARFIEPILLLKTDALPDQGERWAYQLKVDGYRAIAFKSGGSFTCDRGTTTISRSDIREF
jgi:ATP-dependent DNA ligase